MTDRLLSLKAGVNMQSADKSSFSDAPKIDVPVGMSPESLLRRRHSTSITSSLLESIPSKLQL